MIIFVLMSAKIEPHVRIFTFSLSYFGKSENIFILHQKMRETSQKMREMVDESTENEERETFYLALSMIAYLHKTIEEAPLLPQDVVNKKTRKLLIFFLSLSLLNHLVLWVLLRSFSLSLCLLFTFHCHCFLFMVVDLFPEIHHQYLAREEIQEILVSIY